MEDNYLIHHGVKGMKWGVRKKQPTAAGTSSKKKISPAEEAKSMSNEELRAKNRRLQLERRYSELTRPGSKSGKYETTEQAARAGSSVTATASKMHKSSVGDKAYDKSIAKDAYGAVGGTLNTVAGSAQLAKKVSDVSKNTKHGKMVNKKLSEMSDEDLAKTVERLDLEKTYTSLKSESSKRGKASVGEILSIAGSAVVVTSSAITAAVTIASLIAKAKNRSGKGKVTILDSSGKKIGKTTWSKA